MCPNDSSKDSLFFSQKACVCVTTSEAPLRRGPTSEPLTTGQGLASWINHEKRPFQRSDE